MCFKRQDLLNHQYFEFDHTNVKKSCLHKECDCFQIVKGTSNVMLGKEYKITYKNMQDDIASFVEEVSNDYGWTLTQDLDPRMKEDVYSIVSAITEKENIKIISPQTADRSYPPDSIPFQPSPVLEQIAKEADLMYWWKKGVHIPASEWRKNIWYYEGQTAPESLQAVILRKKSIYNAVFGKINGRPQAILASVGLFPNKWKDAVLLQQRKVRKHPEELSEVWKYVEEALDLLYMKMGTEQYRGTLAVPLTIEGIDGAFLGSSSGDNIGTDRVIYSKSDPPVEVSPSGKKLENFEPDMYELFNFLVDEDADPFVVWELKQKVEMFYSNTKQMNDEEFDKWLKKVRIFVIPSSFYILMERVVSKVRHMIERGNVIRVGQKWSHGGADEFARCLGINSENEMKQILFEGDLKNFDQSVLAKLVDLYFMHMLVYEIPGTENYKLRQRIVKWLSKHMVNRITHLFGELWGIQIGGVPSGAFNTSHIDSWVMALYLCFFFTYQAYQAPQIHQDQLLQIAVDIILFCVYGDDHAVNITDDPLAQHYFSGEKFKVFMKHFFDVDIRDLLTNLTFLTEEVQGQIVRRGLTFLRHQFVRNKCQKEKQPRYLPYRETWEYLIRAFWGKDGRQRDELDLMLSVIGHAYGTYASNADAYEKLRVVYTVALAKHGGSIEEIKNTLRNRVVKNEDSMRDFRRRGITVDELVEGFPTWETLEDKNEWKEEYHIIREVYYDVDYLIEE